VPAPKEGLRKDSDRRPENFWPQVSTGTKKVCWPWAGKLSPEGYGRPKGDAHRIAWELTHGKIPKGKCVLHRCDNRPCCNPSHLFLGTRKENNADRDRKGRLARGTRIGTSKLTERDVMELRAEYAKGNTTHRELAAKRGLDHTTVGDILRGTRWQHV